MVIVIKKQRMKKNLQTLKKKVGTQPNIHSRDIIQMLFNIQG